MYSIRFLKGYNSLRLLWTRDPMLLLTFCEVHSCLKVSQIYRHGNQKGKGLETTCDTNLRTKTPVPEQN